MGFLDLSRGANLSSQLHPSFRDRTVFTKIGLCYIIPESIEKLSGKNSDEAVILPEKIPANQIVRLNFGTILNEHYPVLLTFNQKLLDYCMVSAPTIFTPTIQYTKLSINLQTFRQFDLTQIFGLITVGVLE